VNEVVEIYLEVENDKHSEESLKLEGATFAFKPWLLPQGFKKHIQIHTGDRGHTRTFHAIAHFQWPSHKLLVCLLVYWSKTRTPRSQPTVEVRPKYLGDSRKLTASPPSDLLTANCLTHPSWP
jgi:hypothetical protein